MPTAQYLVAVEEIPSPTTSQNLRAERLLQGAGRVTRPFCAQCAIFLNSCWWTGAGKLGVHNVCVLSIFKFPSQVSQLDGKALGGIKGFAEATKRMTHCLCWSFLFISNPAILEYIGLSISTLNLVNTKRFSHTKKSDGHTHKKFQLFPRTNDPTLCTYVTCD